MKNCRKIIALTLFFTITAQQAAVAADERITKNRPVIEKASAERDLPYEEVTKVATWFWWTLAGVAVIGGGAVALGGSKKQDSAPAANSGVNITW
jgi:hypothetical protein